MHTCTPSTVTDRFAVWVHGDAEGSWLDRHFATHDEAVNHVYKGLAERHGGHFTIGIVRCDKTCGTCGEPIAKVVELHATYYVAGDGDSLSYVPTLHDHKPA